MPIPMTLVQPQARRELQRAKLYLSRLEMILIHAPKPWRNSNGCIDGKVVITCRNMVYVATCHRNSLDAKGLNRLFFQRADQRAQRIYHPRLSPAHIGYFISVKSMSLVVKISGGVLHIVNCPQGNVSGKVYVAELCEADNCLGGTMYVYGMNLIVVVLRGEIIQKEILFVELQPSLKALLKAIDS